MGNNGTQINHCIEMAHHKLGRSVTARFKLIGIPGYISHEDDVAKAYPESKDLEYIQNNLIKPISQALFAYSPKNGTPLPQIKLIFDPSCESEDKQKLQEELSQEDEFLLEIPKYTIDQVVLSKTTMAHLKAVLSLISQHQLIYETWNLKSVVRNGSAITLNFWGPSGTGKTHCAEAIAGTLGKKLVRANYAYLESKYVGETSKNITRLFHLASQHDAVLFFDEADSLLGKRLTNVSQSADHGVNMSRTVMLLELERFNGIVVFATNLLQNYDIAFSRRLLHQIEFTLPDEEGRIALYKLHIPRELPTFDDVTPQWMASQSGGLSGGEILNIVLKMAAKAASEAVPENEKRVSRKHVEESVKEIREAKAEIEASEWMNKKFQEKLSKKKED